MFIKDYFTNDKEFAVIFSRSQSKDGSYIYIPVDVVEGKINRKELIFMCGNTKIKHLINKPQEIGFALSKETSDEIRNHIALPFFIQKKLLLQRLQNFIYIYAENKDKYPLIGVKENTSKENSMDILYEEELLKYYIHKYPKAKEIIYALKKAGGKINLDSSLLAPLIEVYGNEKQINEVYTSIWKYMHGNKPYNIFINGNNISPKKEIVKNLLDSTNIPYYYLNMVENYEITDIYDYLRSLLEGVKYDLNSLNNSVLVIDNIDKLAQTDSGSDAFIKAQYDLSKVLRGEIIDISYGKRKVIKLDTSKMMIIGIGSFEEEEEIIDRNIPGFGNKFTKNIISNNKYKNGMLEGLFNNFQMFIEMDSPSIKDYLNVINNSDLAGITSNIDFFSKFNINLNFTPETIMEIARKSHERSFTIPEIRDFIENIISNASFEIAKNRSNYKELIITPETIKDNRNYKLIKKREKK